MRGSARSAFIVLAAVTAVAGPLRLWDLSNPSEKVFDEVYYATDGCWYAGIEHTECGLESDVERSWVHPPLGKQMIGWGIDLFGNRPLGWRIAAAAAGTAAVALVGWLGWLLTASVLWSGMAASLAAAESLLFVQSRLAMLDVFLALFVVLGFALLALDRKRSLVDGARPRGVWRPWRLSAGAAFGAAAAVKWSGVFALAGGIVLAVATERTLRRRRGEPRPLFTALWRGAPGMLLAFAVVPLAVYAAAWLPWLADRGFDLREWVHHHGDMAEYHAELDTVKENGEPTHPYMSRAWTWLLLARPVAYFYEGTTTSASEIIGLGNPAIFWSSLAVLPYLALRWRREPAAGYALVPALTQYLPWLLVSRPLFLFYMTPVAPFLALGLALALRDLGSLRLRGRRLMPIAVGTGLACVILFAFLWPVLVGDTISMDAWRLRIWFRSWV